LLAVLLVFASVPARAKDEDKYKKISATTGKDHDGEMASVSTVELNPDYVSDDGEDSNDEYDDEEYEYDSEDEEENPKSKSRRAMGISRRKSRKDARTAVDFVKKHRMKITCALALVAFRREIGRFIMGTILAPASGVDAKTGKVIRKLHVISPTSLLKIIVFFNVVRQIQVSGMKRGPLILPLLLFGARNPVLWTLISKSLLQNDIYLPPIDQHYTFERLNERYTKDCLALEKAAASYEAKSEISLSAISNLHSQDIATQKNYSETVIILDLTKVESNRIEMLRDETSFLIHQHRQKTVPYSTSMGIDKRGNQEVEILILLESPGGSASEFALASEQLLRLRKEPGIRVTVCVDKVAASGGYMIACAADPGKLFAAPFAVLGSIGVIGQAFNIQKMLEGWGVRPLVFRAGPDKAPLGLVGDITTQGLKSTQSMLDDCHKAFKRHVVQARPILAGSIEELATGKIWFGTDALEVGLVDRLISSDEYIGERMRSGARVLKLIKNTRKRSLFGGNQSPRTGIDNRMQSSIIDPLKASIKMALLGLVEKMVLPLDSLQGMPLSAKAAASAQVTAIHSSSHMASS